LEGDGNSITREIQFHFPQPAQAQTQAQSFFFFLFSQNKSIMTRNSPLEMNKWEISSSNIDFYI
jgi:hypothetical protein